MWMYGNRMESCHLCFMTPVLCPYCSDQTCALSCRDTWTLAASVHDGGHIKVIFLPRNEFTNINLSAGHNETSSTVSFTSPCHSELVGCGQSCMRSPS